MKIKISKTDITIIFFLLGLITLFNPIQSKVIRAINPTSELCLTYQAKFSPYYLFGNNSGIFIQNLNVTQIRLRNNKNENIELTVDNELIENLYLGSNYIFKFGMNDYAEPYLMEVKEKC